jgi:hypothetical protein
MENRIDGKTVMLMIDNIGKKGGFFDLPKDEKKCNDPEHEAPNMIYIPPGKGYRHVCPKCGEESIIIPQQVTMKMQKMREEANTVFELTKGFTTKTKDNAMKAAEEMAGYVLELTN